MTGKGKAHPDLQAIPMLPHETLYVGIDIGKLAHVAGFASSTLLARHQRFEACPALSFENSREGFRALVDCISAYVPLTQIYVLLEVTGHYHRALLQYLQEMEIPVYVMHVQKRQKGLLKTDKRDALGLANHLYNQLEKGIQVGDPLQVVRKLPPPPPAAAQLRGMVQQRRALHKNRQTGQKHNRSLPQVKSKRYHRSAPQNKQIRLDLGRRRRSTPPHRPNARFLGWWFPLSSRVSCRVVLRSWNVPTVKLCAPSNHMVESCGSRLTTHAKRRLPIPASAGPEGKRIGMWLEGETPTD